jgi:predicted nucleic acid-binding protein
VNGLVVVDASLAFKWLVEEEHSDNAHAVLLSWDTQDIGLAAPHFMPVEVTNALHRRVLRGDMTVEVASDLIEGLLSSRLELHETPHMHARALELASQLHQGAVYDAHYLALAETLGCDLWTADEKFYRVASPVAGNVRWVGEFPTPLQRLPGSVP